MAVTLSDAQRRLMRLRLSPPALPVVSFAISLAFAVLGLSLAQESHGLAPLWPINAVVLVALLRIPSLPIAKVLGGAFIGILTAYLLYGTGSVVAAGLAAANIVEIAIGLMVMRRIGEIATPPQALRNIAVFLLGAGALAPLASAPLAATVLAMFGNGHFAASAVHWFAAHGLGMVMLGPLLLAAGCADCQALMRSRRIFEVGGVVAGAAATSLLVFGQSRYPALFIVFPVLIIAVFRLRFTGAAVSIAIVALIASGETLRGNGPIAGSLSEMGERILYLQAFLAVAVVSSVPFAAILVERGRVLAQLAESEKQYRLLADHSNDMIVRIGFDGLRRYISPACRSILGYEPHELLGETPFAVIHADDRARVERVCRSLLDGAIEPVCAYRQRRSDGDYVWLEATYRLVHDDAGVPVEFVASVRDIGKRREAELEGAEAQAQMEESHRLLIMAEGLAGVGHWRLDLHTKSIFWSDEVFRIHGRAIGDIPPLDEAINAYHPDDRAMVANFVEQVSTTGTSYSFRARIIRPDGELRHVESSGQGESAPDGTILGVVGVFRDITDRVEAEAQLIDARDEARASAEAKSAFLATMSHEIRTPMTGVLGMIELLRADLPEEDRARFFDNLEQSASLLMSVLDDVLDFSKIESGSLILESVDFDIAELTRNTLDLFHHAASKKGLLLTLDCPVGRDNTVCGDPTRLQQILSNLISNAIKFTPAGSVEIRVRINPTDLAPVAFFEVRDTGIGIEAEVAHKLFEPFVQADASTTRRFGGTGLGLAISKRLVEAMGGAISVESVPGTGTVFRFNVPVERQRRGTNAAATEAPATNQRLSILLAEDNLVNRALVEALVRRAGHNIRCVENGLLAVNAANSELFDVILMDMQMPEMDGIAATRAIRTGGGPCANSPIIALTADASAERRRFYDNVGLTDFLTKPVDTALLTQRLSAIADKKRAAPADASAAVDPMILDEVKLDELEQLVGAAAVARLLALFLNELGSHPGSIARLIVLDDRAAIAAEAHALKGAALNIGAARVGGLARLLEQAADTDQDLAPLGRAINDAALATEQAITARTKRKRYA